jgi:phage gp37-like protein
VCKFLAHAFPARWPTYEGKTGTGKAGQTWGKWRLGNYFERLVRRRASR